MSFCPISQIPEEWDLTEETHERVLENIGAKIGVDFSTKEQSYLDSTEVDIGTYMEALREVDGRTWHDRAIDALLQWNVEIFDSSEYDLLLRDIDHNYTKAVHPGKPSAYYNIPLKKGDLDFARLSVLEDKLRVEVYEVKTHEKDLIASNKLDEVAELHERVEHRTGSEFEVVKREMLPQHVSKVLNQIDDPYGIPKKYYGLAHYTEDSRQELAESEDFSNWRSHFLANDDLTLDYRDLLKEVKREKFL